MNLLTDEFKENNAIYILKYCSQNFNNPLYLIWYTDNDEIATNRLLTFKTGEIFTTTSFTNLKKTITQEKDNLYDSDNILKRLDDFKPSEDTIDSVYDLDFVITCLNNKNLDIPTIEDFATFINLYDDFIHQDVKNSHLQIHRENILVREVWDYYYEFIFWPRFNDKTKFEVWNRPPLVINSQELAIKLKEIIDTFEHRFKLKL